MNHRPSKDWPAIAPSPAPQPAIKTARIANPRPLRRFIERSSMFIDAGEEKTLIVSRLAPETRQAGAEVSSSTNLGKTGAGGGSGAPS